MIPAAVNRTPPLELIDPHLHYEDQSSSIILMIDPVNGPPGDDNPSRRDARRFFDLAFAGV